MAKRGRRTWMGWMGQVGVGGAMLLWLSWIQPFPLWYNEEVDSWESRRLFLGRFIRCLVHFGNTDATWRHVVETAEVNLQRVLALNVVPESFTKTKRLRMSLTKQTNVVYFQQRTIRLYTQDRLPWLVQQATAGLINGIFMRRRC